MCLFVRMIREEWWEWINDCIREYAHGTSAIQTQSSHIGLGVITVSNILLESEIWVSLVDERGALNFKSYLLLEPTIPPNAFELTMLKPTTTLRPHNPLSDQGHSQYKTPKSPATKTRSSLFNHSGWVCVSIRGLITASEVPGGANWQWRSGGWVCMSVLLCLCMCLHTIMSLSVCCLRGVGRVCRHCFYTTKAAMQQSAHLFGDEA